MEQNVFVIIVTYNGEHWLHKNLESLRASQYPVKTIVVDNNSTDSSVAIVKSFPEVELIVSSSNLGFGQANNLGIKKAQEEGADYVFLLNQDAWIFTDTIEKLVKAASQDMSFGIISPFHLGGDEKTTDQNFETYWQRKIKTLASGVDEVPFVNAAAWMLPVTVINKIGYFEPLFSHYGEDRNYSNRLRFHGYKTVVITDAKICHDRIISRSFNKDAIQSKFQMLNQVLDVNDHVFMGYLKAFKSVVGLPKYFFKYYGARKSLRLFSILFPYFIRLKLMIFTILKKRRSYT